MTNEEIVKEIKEVMELNRAARRRSNDILCRAMNRLDRKDVDAYERGMNDIWEALKKVSNMSTQDTMDCFGTNTFYGMLKNDMRPLEFISKLEAYEKKKEEEDRQQYKRGDKVACVSSRLYAPNKFDAIYLGEDNDVYWTLKQRDCVPQCLSKEYWTLLKYGETVDIDSLLP